MGKRKKLLLGVAASLLLAVAFWFLISQEKSKTDTFFVLDIAGIQARGTLRVAVDNNSSSYYIYRGRRMGYEYELLLDLGKRLGVQIEFVVASEIEEAFGQLEEGRVDLIAMNVQKNKGLSSEVNFTEAVGSTSTYLVGNKKLANWQNLGSDTVVVRKGAVYKQQLEQIKDSLDLDFLILEELKL